MRDPLHNRGSHSRITAKALTCRLCWRAVESFHLSLDLSSPSLTGLSEWLFMTVYK